MRVRLLLLVLTMLVGGCARGGGASLPQYPQLSDEQAISVLRERAREVETVSGEGLITLTRGNGESVRFDGAVAMRPPEEIRIRAWKFGQAAFDVTLNPDGLWVLWPADDQREAEMRGANVQEMVRQWVGMWFDFFESGGLEAQRRGDELVVSRREGDTTIMCRVNAGTMTVRSYEIIDAQGKMQFRMKLDRYTVVDGIVWPRRLKFWSRQEDRIRLELRGVEINADLPAGAFVPPRRAEKAP